MSRVWIYDRSNSAKYQAAASKARTAGRPAPARYLVMFYDNGRQRSRSATTRTEALVLREQLEARLGKTAKVTFGEIAEQWLDRRCDLRPSTWWKYRGLLDTHVLPRWAEVPLAEITTAAIGQWITILIKPAARGGSALGPSQTRHVFYIVAMVLQQCVPRPLPVNPARGVALPNRPDADQIYLTHQQVEDLATAASDLRTKYHRPTAAAHVNRALILLLAYTGLRWGEAAALRVRHVNLTTRRIRVTATVYEINGQRHLGPPKSGRRRSVPIPPFLVDDLAALISNRPADGFVFTTRAGKPLQAHNWRAREFDPAVTAAGLNTPSLTPHNLRHTTVSLAIAAGADIYVVQRLLGHNDPATTLNTYGHLLPDNLDHVATTLDHHRRQAITQTKH
jgi:integrase